MTQPIPLVCPTCGAMNKPDAKPVIIQESDGSWSCTYCGSTFRRPPIAELPSEKP
jgi:hypothetical protein